MRLSKKRAGAIYRAASRAVTTARLAIARGEDTEIALMWASDAAGLAAVEAAEGRYADSMDTALKHGHYEERSEA